MHNFYKIFFSILFGFMFGCLVDPGLSHADSWGQPHKFDVVSIDGSCTAEVSSNAEIFKKDKNGKSEKIYSIKLVNEVMPTGALVTNDGEYIVTLDNWGSVGYGDDVVVFYERPGKIIKKYALENFLDTAEVKFATCSVSSRRWRKKEYIDESKKQFCVFVNGEKFYNLSKDRGRKIKMKLVKFDLKTGAVVSKEDYLMINDDSREKKFIPVKSSE